jgi:hypothetical protein
MPEPIPFTCAIAEGELAGVVVRMSCALEQATELLEAASDIHRKLLELHAALTEPLVDLERLLRDAREQMPAQPG